MDGEVLRQSLNEDRLGRGKYVKARKVARTALDRLHDTSPTQTPVFVRDTLRIAAKIKSGHSARFKPTEDFQFDAGDVQY